MYIDSCVISTVWQKKKERLDTLRKHIQEPDNDSHDASDSQ